MWVFIVNLGVKMKTLSNQFLSETFSDPLSETEDKEIWPAWPC